MRFFLLLPLVCVTATVGAQERLFLGKVKQVTMRASGFDGCPPAIQEHKDSAGKVVSVSVDNACGCAETTIAITRALAGKKENEQVRVDGPVGEWCRPVASIGSTVLLQQNAAGAFHFAPTSVNAQHEDVVDARYLHDHPAGLREDPAYQRDGTIPLKRVVELYTTP